MDGWMDLYGWMDVDGWIWMEGYGWTDMNGGIWISDVPKYRYWYRWVSAIFDGIGIGEKWPIL